MVRPLDLPIRRLDNTNGPLGGTTCYYDAQGRLTQVTVTPPDPGPFVVLIPNGEIDIGWAQPSSKAKD